jgi:hypothetical protein
MTVALRYLSFEVSEDGDGNVNFDAMASVLPDHVHALQAEVQQVLAWARGPFAGTEAPLDEGGDWDCDVQTTEEPEAGKPHTTRTTLTLSITGTVQFAEAFEQQFSWD